MYSLYNYYKNNNNISLFTKLKTLQLLHPANIYVWCLTLVRYKNSCQNIWCSLQLVSVTDLKQNTGCKGLRTVIPWSMHTATTIVRHNHARRL